jgi:hypothetical protein
MSKKILHSVNDGTQYDILVNYCPYCDKKHLCDAKLPHPYNNSIWHSCIHKKRIVNRLIKHK